MAQKVLLSAQIVQRVSSMDNSRISVLGKGDGGLRCAIMRLFSLSYQVDRPFLEPNTGEAVSYTRSH